LSLYIDGSLVTKVGFKLMSNNVLDDVSVYELMPACKNWRDVCGTLRWFITVWLPFDWI